MQHLIKQNQIVTDDPWHLADSEQDLQAASTNSVFEVSAWQTHGEFLSASNLTLGALVKEGEDLQALLPYLTKLSLVVFEFGKFADGRAYTLAHQLRRFHKFSGEIRASGDFLPDQVSYLERVGFDTFACRNSIEAEEALAIKETITVAYQVDAKYSQPLFRNR